MKKVFKVCLAVLMMVILVGCGNKEQKEVAENFMVALSSGNVEKAKLYCTNDIDIEFINSLEDLSETLLDSNEMGKDFVKKAELSVDKIYAKFFSDYKIDKITKKDEYYTVNVKVTTIDTSNINIDSFTKKIENITQTYILENIDNLQDIYLDKGEDGFIQYVYSQIADDILKELEKIFNECNSIEGNMTLTLKETSIGWKIISCD